MEIVGFARISKNAPEVTTRAPMENFRGQACPVYEFAEDGGVLVRDIKGLALAMFDKKDVHSSFRCSWFSHIICPPDLDWLAQSAYVIRCQERKGGYEKILRSMVIQASLALGKFHDNFLWALEKEEQAATQ